MKLTNKVFSAVFAALFLVFSAHAATVGKKAPEFTLMDAEGKTHSLSDFSGKMVVLEWTNHGCPFVKKFYRSGKMQEYQAMAADKDIVWLKICSSAEGKQGYMTSSQWMDAKDEKGIKAAAVLIDETGEVGRAYGAKVTPHMYVIDEKGVLAYNGAIDSIASTSPADIEKAENYVLAAINSLKAGKSVEKATSRPYGCSIKWAPSDS